MRRGDRFVALAMAAALAGLQTGGAAWAESPAKQSTEPPEARMELLLAPAAPVADPASIVVERVAGGDREAVPVRVREADEGRLAVDLEVPCAAEALYRVHAPGLVSLVFALPPAACAEGERPALEVPLLAAGRVAARFLPPPGRQLHGDPQWTVRDCRSAGRAPVFTFSLPLVVGPEGEAEAVVPTGCLDLLARFPGFAPETALGVEVPPGERRDLGTRRLTPAVEVALTVVDSAGRAPVREVEVLLTAPKQAPGVVRELLAGRRPRVLGREVSDRDGRVVFEGLPAGAHAVVVVPRSETLASVVAEAPDLAPGARHDLGKVREQLGAAITVVTEAEAGAEQLELLAQLAPAAPCTGEDGPVLTPAIEKALMPGGAMTVGGLPAGAWRVELLALDGEGRAGLAGSRTVELAEGEVQFVEFPAAPLLLGLTYHGRVEDDAEAEAGERQEERGLAFDLGFSWPEQEGRTGGTVYTDSERDGSFTIRLPGPGKYTVRWFDPASEQMIIVPDVRFEDPRDEVIVRPLRGRIEGRVVDEEGEPVRKGFVEALGVDCGQGPECEVVRPTRAPSARLREDGSFALTRLAGGSYRLRAGSEGDEEASDSKIVELPEDGQLTGIVLVLRASRPLDLAFVSAEGFPLATAGGLVFALRADGEVDGHQFVTDVGGRATVRLRGGARGRALVLLDAPGRAIAGFRVDTGRGGPHRLVVPPTGSLLLRAGPRGSKERAVLDEGFGGAALLMAPLYLVGAEAILPLGGLLNLLQTGLPDGALRLDGLAAGSWVLVRSPEGMLFSVLRRVLRDQQLPGVPLASFHLEPGGEVVFDLAAEAAADDR
ncbi:MAG TPA: hypothetical protein P5199_13540 [Thermoanaerobaculia bacterium]|nr:hypothetical protein [Thermoanaerobaculia bacterium]